MKLSVLLFPFSHSWLCSIAHYAKYPQELKANYPKGYPDIKFIPDNLQDLKANYPKDYPKGQKCAYGMRYEYVCGDPS
ncbi:unnamed protein product, partial [Mesorhabditis belari]|uniref:Uncharacterized protein n=1 Tax=Mesorhabditis belari TaxID=2138241 RepID=A0AAF3F8S6_9BILA